MSKQNLNLTVHGATTLGEMQDALRDAVSSLAKGYPHGAGTVGKDKNVTFEYSVIHVHRPGEPPAPRRA